MENGRPNLVLVFALVDNEVASDHQQDFSVLFFDFGIGER